MHRAVAPSVAAVATARLAATSGAMLIAGPLLAQAAPAPAAPTREQQRMIGDFARCLVEKHRSEAVEFVLDSNVASNKPAIPSRRARRDCSSGRSALAKMDGPQRDTLLFALGDALVREEFPTFAPRVVETAQPLPAGNLVDTLWPLEACRKCKPRQLKDVRHARTRSQAILAPQVFGECVVRTDPANAHGLIVAEPGSASEGSALKALAPAFSHCVMAGARFEADRAFMRGILAVSYYRIAHAPRVRQPGAEK